MLPFFIYASFPPSLPIGKSSLIDGTDAALALGGYGGRNRNERRKSELTQSGSKSQLGQSQTMLMSYTDGRTDLRISLYATAPRGIVVVAETRSLGLKFLKAASMSLIGGSVSMLLNRIGVLQPISAVLAF